MKKYIASIDQGTTSTRFMVFNHAGEVVALDQKEHKQIYPKPGWVEHDPLEIWVRTHEVIAGALKKGDIDANEIAAIAIFIIGDDILLLCSLPEIIRFATNNS